MSKIMDSISEYLQVILLSLLIYIACMMVSNTPIVDTIINDILLIILSFVLVYFNIRGNDLIIYAVYLVLFILLLNFIQPYAFIVAVSLLSILCVECVHKIINNEDDFKLIKEEENGL